MFKIARPPLTTSHLSPLDLAKPEGQAIVRRLATMSDVLIENFKVGDLKRYGL